MYFKTGHNARRFRVINYTDVYMELGKLKYTVLFSNTQKLSHVWSECRLCRPKLCHPNEVMLPQHRSYVAPGGWYRFHPMASSPPPSLPPTFRVRPKILCSLLSTSLLNVWMVAILNLICIGRARSGATGNNNAKSRDRLRNGPTSYFWLQLPVGLSLDTAELSFGN